MENMPGAFFDFFVFFSDFFVIFRCFYTKSDRKKKNKKVGPFLFTYLQDE